MAHHRHVRVCNGASRIALVTSDYVIKWDYNKRGVSSWGGNVQEVEMYKIAEKAGYSYLFAELTSVWRNGILFNNEDILLCGVFKDGECISNEGLPKDVVDKLFNSDKGKYKMFPYSDGSLYVGEMNNETRHGYGVFFNANKTQFVGEWRYDDLEGNVCIRYNDGKQYIGKLANDEYNGKSIFISYKNDIDNYIVEIGKHNEGVKEGVFIQYKYNNEVTKFWHEQGKVHKILYIDKDKNLSLVNYKDDIEHGEAFHIDSKSRKINANIFEYGKLIK
jgi:hypothetical protein